VALVTVPPCFDSAVVEDLVGLELSGASKFFSKQAEGFAKRAALHLTDIEACLQRGDSAGVAEQLHKFGGYCGMLGAKNLREVLLRNEQHCLRNGSVGMEAALPAIRAAVAEASDGLALLLEQVRACKPSS
jgi:hypothetical protein